MSRGWFSSNLERPIAEPRTVTQCPVCGLENNRVLYRMDAPALFQDCGHRDDRKDTSMTDTPDIRVGDVVRVGKGKKLWTVAGFWGHGNDRVDLHPLPGEGYSKSSAELHRLTVIDRPVDTRPDGVQEQPC